MTRLTMLFSLVTVGLLMLFGAIALGGGIKVAIITLLAAVTGLCVYALIALIFNWQELGEWELERKNRE
jgi:hypothetical protein